MAIDDSRRTTTWTVWQDYGATKTWRPCTGVGTKTVCVKDVDHTGNVSTAVKDTIVYRP